MPEAVDEFGGIAVEDAPAGADDFGGLPVEAGPDLSKIKLSPYDQAAIEAFRQGRGKPESGMESGTELTSAVASDPVGFVKSIPSIVGGAMMAPGRLAYAGAADLVSKGLSDWKGVSGDRETGGSIDREYGGNLAAMMRGEDQLPAENLIGISAQSSPNVAVGANIAKSIAEMAPLLGMSVLPATINRIAAGVFSLQMIAGVKAASRELGTELGKPEEDRDAGKIASLKSDLIQTGIFAPLAGAGAASGLIKPRGPKGAMPPDLAATAEAVMAAREAPPAAPEPPVRPQAPPEGVRTAPESPEPSPAPPGEAAKPRTLTPALLVDGKPVSGIGEHADIFKAEIAKADDPDLIDALMKAQGDDKLHVFVDENGTPLTRLEAAKAFKEITGKEVSDPKKGLQSQDLIEAGLQKPAAKAQVAAPAPPQGDAAELNRLTALKAKGPLSLEDQAKFNPLQKKSQGANSRAAFEALQKAADEKKAAAAPTAPPAESQIVGNSKGKNMPSWVREAMMRAGLDPNRPLNDIDLLDPKIREAVRNDPTLTPEQKAQILKTGSPARPPAAAPEKAAAPTPAASEKGTASLVNPPNPGLEAASGISTPEVIEKLATPGLEAGRRIKEGIQSLMLPSAKGPASLKAAELLGSKLGPMHRRGESSAARLRPYSRMFDKLGVDREGVAPTDNKGIRFMSDMSQGRPLIGKLKAASDLVQSLFSDRIAALEKADAPLQTVRENYFPGMWTKESRLAFNAAMEKMGPDFDLSSATPNQKASIKSLVDQYLREGKGSDKDAIGYLTRKPMKGRESFRKQKVFDDIMDGAELGLRPISNNPVDLVMLKLAEMDRSIMANEYFQALKARGEMKVIHPGAEIPDGWVKLNDKYGTIYGPPVEGVFGRRIVGYRIVPEAHGEIANNYLSSSLYNNRYFGALYKGWIGAANALNQTQLGMGSAFHAGFTTGEAQISSGANVLKDIYGVLRGNRSTTDLGKSISKTVVGTIRNPIIGDRVLNAWRSPDGQINPRIAQVVRAAELGGGGFKMESGLRTEQSTKLLRDWYSGHRIRAAARSPVALSELLVKPTLDLLVPRQKAGVFADLAWRIIEQNPGKALEELTPQFRQAWNRVDARLGQVRYDRLFINNTAKNVVQGLVRAPGWSGGTIAEIGGGFADAGRFLSEWVKTGKLPENLPDRTAYVISLLTTVGATNAALTYAFTGTAPKGLDFFAFRTGHKDEQGREERFMIPSYVKDLLAYARHPIETLRNKSHPLLSILSDIAKNKDYYGVEIRSRDASLAKQTGQAAAYVVKGFEPFWTRGTRREIQRGAKPVSPRTVAPFFGIMPAPRSVTQTSAEGLAHDLMMEQIPSGARTQEQAERSKLKAQSKPATDYLVRTVKKLNAPSAVRVWQKANTEERAKISNIVAGKISKSKTLSPATKEALRKLTAPTGSRPATSNVPSWYETNP